MTVSMDDKRRATLGGEEVEVRTLPIGKYLEVFDRLEALPFAVSETMAANGGELAPAIIAAVRTSANEFFDIVAIASGKERQWIIDNVTPYELADYVEKMIEVNRIPDVLKKFGAVIRKGLQILRPAA